ncbi:MAG: MBL fold metallo-hydrolase [Candidatus Eremiobacteraeota bacterium]|nr:MBL fold metallo-hydrolase [Candidatus Eremiobacteraeota bacterium]
MKAPSLAIKAFAASEAGSWSNAYLISRGNKAVLFDACMLRSDAGALADAIEKTGKTLATIVISHAHPDHFLALEFLKERFPQASIVSTSSVVADLRADGPSLLSLLQGKLGPQAPEKLVIPPELEQPVVWLDDIALDIVEFGESESKHIAAIHIGEERALFCADLIYNGAHLYLAERHLSGWMQQLNELESFVRLHDVATIYPGHGTAGGPELIEKTRTYLRDFETAIALGDAKAAEDYMLSKYPDYRVKPFLTAFSIPAYFPNQNTTQ